MVDFNIAVRLMLKLFGVGLIVYGAVILATYLPMLLVDQDWRQLRPLVLYVTPMIVPFLFGVFLWLFPAPIANTIVRPGPLAKDSEVGWAPELERIGVSLLGLFLLYRSISDLIYHVMTHQAKVAMLGNVRAPDDFGALMTATIVEFVLALFLMLRSKGIVNVLRKARVAGQQ